MRWPATKEKYPKEGAIRIRTAFAFWPIRCGDEIVWLEKYNVEEILKHNIYEGYYWLAITHTTWDAEVRS